MEHNYDSDDSNEENTVVKPRLTSIGDRIRNTISSMPNVTEKVADGIRNIFGTISNLSHQSGEIPTTQEDGKEAESPFEGGKKRKTKRRLRKSTANKRRKTIRRKTSKRKTKNKKRRRK